MLTQSLVLRCSFKKLYVYTYIWRKVAQGWYEALVCKGPGILLFYCFMGHDFWFKLQDDWSSPRRTISIPATMNKINGKRTFSLSSTIFPENYTTSAYVSMTRTWPDLDKRRLGHIGCGSYFFGGVVCF